ncbi:MerR family transcriptional regulator [Arthrobacter ulcerisalmonis]|nr:MerR family transcriptional regulator [Arthrobacter ulcerisalmonis]
MLPARGSAYGTFVVLLVLPACNAGYVNDFGGVGAVAVLLGVSVRTLHHWHQIGIAVPSDRSAAGYRLYSEADIARLRRVLLFRDLGVPLQSIPDLLAAGAAERRQELEGQRAGLAAKIRRLQELDREVDLLLAADEQGTLLSKPDEEHAFGRDWDRSWTMAARQRWADSPQWAEYTERSAARTAEDWRVITSAMHSVTEHLAEAKRDAVLPGSERANALAESHRKVMSEYFHCTHSMHVLIAQRYVNESGYLQYFESLEPGLADWMKQAIEANARTADVDPDTATWG